MVLSLTDICLLSIAVPTSVASLVGHACAPRRATRTYLGSVVVLCFAVAATWTYLIYLGNGPTHYEPIGRDFVASLLIFPSLALAPAASVYPCVSGTVSTRHILPLALAASVVALPVWLCTTLIVLHYFVGGM
jgi:ABC-type microcin C transport system permease subunit YejE